MCGDSMPTDSIDPIVGVCARLRVVAGVVRVVALVLCPNMERTKNMSHLKRMFRPKLPRFSHHTRTQPRLKGLKGCRVQKSQKIRTSGKVGNINPNKRESPVYNKEPPNNSMHVFIVILVLLSKWYETGNRSTMTKTPLLF